MSDILLFLQDVGSFIQYLVRNPIFYLGFGVGALIFLHVGEWLALRETK